MADSTIKTRLASDSSLEEISLFVELWHDGILFADVEVLNNELVVNIYPRQGGNQWTIPYHDFLEALKVAKDKLKEKE